MLKDFQVDLELSPKHNGLINTRARFYSHDVNTAKLYVRLNKNGELINLSKEATVRIVMLMTINNENKKHVYEMNYEELGLVSILLPKQILGYQGQVTAGVYVDYGEGQSTDNGYFIFNMERSLIDEDFPELDTVYVSEFEKALEEMNEILHEFDDFETDVNERLGNITTNIDEMETNVLTKLDELDKKIDDKDVAKQPEIEIRHNRLTHGVDYIEPPLQGYKKGDIWYFTEGSQFPGMNLISLKNEQTTESRGVVTFDSYKESLSLDKDVDITLMLEAKLREGENNKFLMYARDRTSQVNTSDRTQRFETTYTPKMFKATVRNNEINNIPQLGVMAHSGAGNKGIALLDFTKPFLCLGKFDNYSLNPYDVIKENRLLIATKDNDGFDFNDWVAYDGEAYKPNFLDMQAQIDELKNAILNQGGTM